jgi:hypothetical protein
VLRHDLPGTSGTSTIDSSWDSASRGRAAAAHLPAPDHVDAEPRGIVNSHAENERVGS